MAILVPDLAEIDSLPQGLTDGERALMNALCETLDDAWMIYVQPHMNRLNPDIVIFSEDAGIGVFEVKDWDLDNYRIVEKGESYSWEVHDGRQQMWVRLEGDKCPIKQVKKYKDSIVKYEIPLLDALLTLNENIYSLVALFVYFHHHNQDYLGTKLKSISKTDPYITIFGRNLCHKKALLNLLGNRYLKHGSKFTQLMKDNDIAGRLRNALAYPKHGETDTRSLLVEFSKKQESLLPNTLGQKRRVFGSAGSGKSLVIVRKAVNAAREGKQVLVVCFNIIMVNYLQDMITRLSRYYGPHVHRNIEVAHYHRIFPNIGPDKGQDCRYMKGMVDVLLIDEGQDFERAWIEQLQAACNPQYHMMFVEDDRQNIYNKNVEARRTVPGIVGRPTKLNKSFRVPKEIAHLANSLIEWTKFPNESGSIEADLRQGSFFTFWVNGQKDVVLAALEKDLARMCNDPGMGAFADIAILVCNVESGWQISKILDRLHLPHQTMFESHQQYLDLKDKYPNHDDFEQKRTQLRRGYKTGFWMQGGRIKVCTIHSFKGWELSRIMIYFDLCDKQDNPTPLLYTAITRCQVSLNVYNANPDFFPFGEMVIQQGIVQMLPVDVVSEQQK